MSAPVLDQFVNPTNNAQDQAVSGGSLEGADNDAVNDSAFYEKFLLEDMDSYWEDLNARLAVSRMVNDSVVKGMVTAVIEEAAEKIASKDAEIEMLKERMERLRSSESAAGSSSSSSSSELRLMSKKSAIGGNLSHSDLHAEQFASDRWSSLKVVSKEHLQRLKNEIECLRKLDSADAQVGSIFYQCNVPENLRKMDESINSIDVILEDIFEQVGKTHTCFMNMIHEQQWKQDFEKEVDAIAVQNFVRHLQEIFRPKSCQEKNLKEKWLQPVDDISNMRDELVAFLNSLPSLEAGLLSHSSHEKIDEQNSHNRKDNSAHKTLSNHTLSYPENDANPIVTNGTKKLDPEVDLSLLSHMSKEELVSHYKTEMTKMKRHHEQALHEKTEEIFALKREIYREKGSLPIRKDKDYESLRKMITEFISKLNVIVQKTNKNISGQHEPNGFYILQDHVNSLRVENLHLKSLLSDRRKEVKQLSSQISNAESQITRQSTVEMKFVHQLKKLKWDTEDARIESNLRDDISKTVLKSCACEAEWKVDALIMENAALAEIYSTILRGSVTDARAVLTSAMARHDEEKGYLISEISSKDEILKLELERINNLKDDLDFQIGLTKEKEILSQEVQLKLLQHEQHSHETLQEISLLRQQIAEQNGLVGVYEKEVNVLKARLNDVNNQVHQYDFEVSKLKQDLQIAIINRERAERQNGVLQETIQKQRSQLLSAVADRELQKNDMNTLLASTLGLSKAFVEFENKATESIQMHSFRLSKMKGQWEPMTQLVDTLRSQIVWYQQNLETKSCNLQKAETEVDLLGDEVDTLLGILAKMYIALDHYSPVMQHYPGVMEILKLVRRALEGTVRPESSHAGTEQ